MDKKLLIGGIILLALGGGAFMKFQEDTKAVKTSAKVELPKLELMDELDSLTITRQVRKDGKDVDEEIVLQKEGDKWQVKKPIVYAANSQAIKSALDSLKAVKLTDVVAQTATDEMKKLYELSADKAVHVVAKKGAETKADWTVGKLGSRGQMLMLGGKPAVYVVEGFSSYSFTKDVKGWRDPEVLRLPEGGVVGVTLTNKAGDFSFTKGAKWGGTLKGKAIDQFDSAKVDDLVRAFERLDATDYGDGKAPAETGLDAPDATVTFALKDNAGTAVVKLGKAAPAGGRYAIKDGNPTVFVVSSFPAEWATAEPSKFQLPPDAGAGKDAGAAPSMGLPPGMGMPPGMEGMEGMPPGHP